MQSLQDGVPLCTSTAFPKRGANTLYGMIITLPGSCASSTLSLDCTFRIIPYHMVNLYQSPGIEEEDPVQHSTAHNLLDGF